MQNEMVAKKQGMLPKQGLEEVNQLRMREE